MARLVFGLAILGVAVFLHTGQGSGPTVKNFRSHDTGKGPFGQKVNPSKKATAGLFSK